MFFTLLARSSSFERPSGLTADLSKSNSTSAAKVTFSATGLGFASGFGSGLGWGFGGGGGACLGCSGSGAGLGGSCVAHAAAKTSATNRIHVFLLILPPALLSDFVQGFKKL